ncbi:FAD-dependent oxidoreductase [Nocardia sp. NPDC051570]|uniref:FAD-dependent oxidoreductase n=1 Tax=Nocardia sp. NPDC051570 TaxID=3364324 RepID=UPI003793724F
MVTVIGGGIAGTVLAGALARHGRAVTVYERRPTVGSGAFLVLESRSHEILAGLGVSIDRLHAISHPLTGLRFESRPDHIEAWPSNGHRLYFRPDLMNVLTDFARTTSAEFHYDTTITAVDPTTATLISSSSSSSTTIAADDLTIAADGIDSVARAHLEPDRRAEYASQILMFGIPDHPVRPSTEKSVLHFIDGPANADGNPTGTFGHFWNDQTAIWFARITQPPIPLNETGYQPAADQASSIHAAIPSLPRLIDTMLDNTQAVHLYNSRTVPLTTAKPPRTSLILCGDADHAITPAAGIGARQALQDVAALHHAILTGNSPSQAMATRRREIIAERQQLAWPACLNS